MIGLDLGTTNCKAVALSPQGQVLATTSSGHAMRSPRPGWAEQDPVEVWQSARDALRALAGRVPPGQAAGISLSGAMHNLLLVDAAGEALSPVATWADQRAAWEAQDLRTQVDAAALYRRTGCPLAGTYLPARLRWWLNESPGLFERARYFVGIKEWVLYQLSGVWATDIGLASTTGLLDIHSRRWDAEALQLAGISAERLPPLLSPDVVAGGLSASAGSGFPAGIPVIAGTHDGGLANLGSGATQPGQVAITVGTSGAVRRIVTQPWLDAQERTWCYVLDENRWLAGGAINNGGLAVEWAREKFYPDLQAAPGFTRLFADAILSAPGAGGVTLLPYFTGERSPYNNPQARAVLTGLRLEHGREQIARAVLEGVAFCLADVWQALDDGRRMGGPARLTGGITRSPVWMQIVADVLGLPLSPLEAADASVVGAALIGLQAVGLIASLDSVAGHLKPAPTLYPDPGRQAAYRQLHAGFQELYRKLF